MRLVLGIAVGLAGLCVTVDAVPPVVRSSKLDQMLQRGAAGPVRVIVRARPGLTPTLRARLRSQGAILKEHALIGAVSTSIPAERLFALEQDDSVASVSLDMVMVDSAATDRATAGEAASTLLATLGLPVQGVTGRGVGVAVIDSGLELSADFGNVAFFDFTPGAGLHPYDDYGHGTHVSGLIASKGVLSQTAAGPLYPGMAPKARLISLKVLDAHGTALTSTVIDAIEFASANKRTLGIDVLAIPLGHPILEKAATDPLVQAVEAASRAGIVVVVAAGNVGRNVFTGVPGYAGILSPANAESAITVGAVDTDNTTRRGDDSIPAYSSRGPAWYDARPKPDIVAPGHNLVSDAALGSSMYLEHPDHRVAVKRSRTRFFRLSGTSMATAVTSGVVALVIEASRTAPHGPAMTPRLIKNILAYTALPMPGYDALTQGHGALNAAGAIAVAKALGRSTPTTRHWWTGLIIPRFTVIGGESWPWGQTTVFPHEVVWGDGHSVPPWAETIVWGTSTDDETIVWGTSFDEETIVWGTTVDWSNAELWGITAPRGASIGSQ